MQCGSSETWLFFFCVQQLTKHGDDFATSIFLFYLFIYLFWLKHRKVQNLCGVVFFCVENGL